MLFYNVALIQHAKDLTIKLNIIEPRHEMNAQLKTHNSYFQMTRGGARG